MRHYIFGFDASAPEKCASLLHEQGINAVVAGDWDQRTLDLLKKYDIEAFLCYGAYGIDSENQICIDALGARRTWFSSGCPNDADLARRHLDAVLRKAQRLHGLRGVFVDGARFASFASVEGAEAFFTCFCPRCMEKMKSFGLDAEQIRKSIAEIQETKQILPKNRNAVSDWLRFRAHCVQQYMNGFADAVHELDLLAGGFVFASSLSPFVGQTAEACRALDIVAPMLYRNYPHPDGPACLGHEWAGLLNLFGEYSSNLAECASNGASLDVLKQNNNARSLLQNGFSSSWIGEEIAWAKRNLHRRQHLEPILQIEDEDLTQTVQYALESGADGIGFFAYGQAPLNLPILQ